MDRCREFTGPKGVGAKYIAPGAVSNSGNYFTGFLRIYPCPIPRAARWFLLLDTRRAIIGGSSDHWRPDAIF